MKLDIRIIKTSEGLAQMKGAWEELEERCNNKNITVSYQWQKIWWDIFGKAENNILGFKKSLNVLIVFKGKELVAIFPLISLTRKFYFFRIRFVEFLAQQWGGTALDILTTGLTEEELDFIFSFLKSSLKYDLLYLRYIPDYSIHFNPKTRNMHAFSLCYEMALNDNYANITHQFYSYNQRRSVYKNKKKVERETENIRKNLVTGLELKDRYFEQCKLLSLTKNLEEGKISIYNDSLKCDFVKEYFFRSGISYLAYYSSSDEFLSYNLGVKYKNKIFAFDTSYNREKPVYRTLGLGALTYDLVVEYFAGHADALCMGTGTDSYKSRFTRNYFKIYSYTNRGNSLYSWLLLPVLQTMLNRKEKRFLAKFNDAELDSISSEKQDKSNGNIS